MKHADDATRERLRDLLRDLRALPPLRERSPGTFYLKSKPFLHFHDDPAGIFADMRIDGSEFTRFNVTTRSQQRSLLARVEQHLRTP